MAYDSEKDQILKNFEPIKIESARYSAILINVCSWDGGEPKIALLYTYDNKDGEPRTTKKIPRLTPDIAAKMASTMQEAVNWINNQGK